MKHDEILGMARKADCGHESMTLDWIAPEGLSAFAKLVEQATLERAAKVCSDMADKALNGGIYIESTGKDAAHSYGQAQSAKLAELAIRALKDSND